MSDSMVNIFWFRRDLRLEDNTGLHHALKSKLPVLLLFIFDRSILDDLEDKQDQRVSFIHQELTSINDQLKSKGSSLLTKYGTPQAVWIELLKEYKVNSVFANRDYEPYARNRDSEIRNLLKENNVELHTFKDHILLEPEDVLKDNGEPYKVFTPYSKLWKKKLQESDLQPHPSALQFDNFLENPYQEIIQLREMGFEKSDENIPPRKVSKTLIEKYHEQRDYPAVNGTSHLGIHLRFGTVSIREVASSALKNSVTFLNELIWREFYQTILWHFPQVVNENFKKKYDAVEWRNNPEEFDAWCEGNTGYPIVDAGMRELNTTGFMHNRVRMIVASFLTKHLLIDWRWGESYFAKKLLDFELASNNGGWQWAAGTGTDAQPYFRIFNPESQTKKFDPDLKYIRKWVPEFQELTYPRPIVDHKLARERALRAFKTALDS